MGAEVRLPRRQQPRPVLRATGPHGWHQRLGISGWGAVPPISYLLLLPPASCLLLLLLLLPPTSYRLLPTCAWRILRSHQCPPSCHPATPPFSPNQLSNSHLFPTIHIPQRCSPGATLHPRRNPSPPDSVRLTYHTMTNKRSSKRLLRPPDSHACRKGGCPELTAHATPNSHNLTPPHCMVSPCKRGDGDERLVTQYDVPIPMQSRRTSGLRCYVLAAPTARRRCGYGLIAPFPP